MEVALTIASRKGRKEEVFWCRIRSLIPYYRKSPLESSKGGMERRVLIVPLCSCEKSINVFSHTPSSPGDLVLVTILSPLSPVPHYLLCSRALLQLSIPWLFEILPFRLLEPPFQVLGVSPMMKNWCSSIGLLCYCLQAFSRPWCLLNACSGILNPLTQLPTADCSYVMFNSWITISTVGLEAFFLWENVFWILMLNSELFF